MKVIDLHENQIENVAYLIHFLIIIQDIDTLTNFVWFLNSTIHPK